MSGKGGKPGRPSRRKSAKKRVPKRGYENPPGGPGFNQQGEWPDPQGEGSDSQDGGRGRPPRG